MKKTKAKTADQKHRALVAKLRSDLRASRTEANGAKATHGVLRARAIDAERRAEEIRADKNRAVALTGTRDALIAYAVNALLASEPAERIVQTLVDACATLPKIDPLTTAHVVTGDRRA